MKNLRVFLIGIILFFSSQSFAQLQRGNLLFGGNANLELQLIDEGDNLFFFNLNSNIQSFVTDQLAVGGGIGLSYTKQGESSNTVLSIAPSARYYFPSTEKMAFFADAAIGVQVFRFNSGFGDGSNSAFVFSFGPGIAFFISEDISLDVGLNLVRIGGDFDQTSIVLGFGVQTYIVKGGE